jgi:CRISPR/Cas system-associated protein Cas10 (large subunit of type III CRISPR-Cas system)
MDGDNLAKRLAGSPDMNGARMEAFQQTVSKVLSAFARDLQKSGSAELNRSLLPGAPNDPQRQPPLLIYAGGEDVLFVCDPRDAIGLASVIQQLYVARFHEQLPGETFTISAAVLFAHTGIPAGTLFRDAETLLKQKAKLESDRNSIAIALHKRSGSPAEATFRWNDDHGINQLDQLTNDLLHLRLASRQTYDFAEADRVLSHVFSSGSEWEQWLTYRLGQGEGSAAHAPELAKRLTPFFMNGQVQALRIARFIAVEIGEPKPAATTGGAS